MNKTFQNWIIPKGKYVSVIHTISSANLGVNYAEGDLIMNLVPTSKSSVY